MDAADSSKSAGAPQLLAGTTPSRLPVPPWLIVAAVAALTFFTNLGGAALFDDDESKNAECAREMFERGDWVVPTFNYNLRPDKPILLYWLMLAAYHLFGVTEFAARFWSAVCGVGTCVLTCGIGSYLYSRKVGLWAGVMLASCLMFTVAARASTPDSTLIFCTTLALFLFVRGTAQHGTWLGDGSAPKASALTWSSLLPAYAAMALAVLAKGPVGVLLPCAVIGLFLFTEAVLREPEQQPARDNPGMPRTWRERFIAGLRRWCRPVLLWQKFLQMRPAAIVLCLAVIALPWYVLVGIETDGAWLRGFFEKHNVGRFTRAMEGHSGPFVFYPLAMMAGFFPWSIFLPWAVVRCVRRISYPVQLHRGHLFVACWAGVYVVFFSLARTKLPSYVLPCYPALALVTAWLLEDRLLSRSPTGNRLIRWGLISLATVGLLLAGGLAVAAPKLLAGQQLLALAGLIPLCGGLAGLWLFRHGRLQPARLCVATTSIVFVLALFAWLAPGISRSQNGPLLAAEFQRLPGPARIGTFNCSPAGLVFYSAGPVHHCRRPEDVAKHLAERGSYLVTRIDRLQRLERHLPPGTTILHKQQRFLRDHTLVILGPEVSRRGAPVTIRQAAQQGRNHD